jgi:hypothetical protein
MLRVAEEESFYQPYFLILRRMSPSAIWHNQNAAFLKFLPNGDQDATDNHQDMIYRRKPIGFGFVQQLTVLSLADQIFMMRPAGLH